MNRRKFTKLAGLGTLALLTKNVKYVNYTHPEIKWENLSDGLNFSRTEVYKEGQLVDTIASLKFNPENYKTSVYNWLSHKNVGLNSIENWQKKTGAIAMINGNQYMAKPFGYPCALVISDGKQIGPKYNQYSSGMFVAEPKDLSSKLKKADLLDFDYDNFDHKTTEYVEGVQHWPILLNKEGKIKVRDTGIAASRTVIGKTKDDEIIFFKTEGSSFSLYDFGEFLKESNERSDNGFNIHTAMNLDGGPTSEMIVKTDKFGYSIGTSKIPCVIGISPRN